MPAGWVPGEDSFLVVEGASSLASRGRKHKVGTSFIRPVMPLLRAPLSSRRPHFLLGVGTGIRFQHTNIVEHTHFNTASMQQGSHQETDDISKSNWVDLQGGTVGA